MKCKKELMGFAAFLIVFFHFWLALSDSAIEQNLFKITFIGVDIFFFVSAYSLGKRGRINQYLEFIGNRLHAVYVPFVLLSIVFCLYKKKTLLDFFEIISGVQFFRRGGGSFLWFFVGIMLFYLITPFLLKVKEKYDWKALIGMFALWLVLVLVLQYGFGYTTIFILINRFPVFAVGLYYDDIRGSLLKKQQGIWMILTGLLVGGALLYCFCGTRRIIRPIADIYYGIAVLFVVSFVSLVDYCFEHVAYRKNVLAMLGTCTLELYGIQMIFGYEIETKILGTLLKTGWSLIAIKLTTFFATFVFLSLVAFLLHLIRDFVIKKEKEFMKNEK